MGKSLWNTHRTQGNVDHAALPPRKRDWPFQVQIEPSHYMLESSISKRLVLKVPIVTSVNQLGVCTQSLCISLFSFSFQRSHFDCPITNVFKHWASAKIKCKGASIWPTFIVYIYESLVLGKTNGAKVSLGHPGGIHWELNANIMGTHWEQENSNKC